MFIEWIKAIIVALIPPQDADPGAAYKWRVTIASLLIAVGGLTMVNSLMILGLMPAFLNIGLTSEVNDLKTKQAQFVTKADIAPLAAGINDIRDGIKQSRIEEITTQLYNLRVLQCGAIKRGDFETAKSHDQQMQTLEFRWRDLVHYDYQRRPCSEL